ncbi:hypothetical protein CAAN1_02S05952 [[Candida] anglica]|uniref:CTLH domain-containing protein n=1 Tax=[Candida] anglica TaxID=148631 RepID=A0ABP0EC75_9ASCO
MNCQTPKYKIDNLILNYFIQEGYQEAAISFAKETGVSLGISEDNAGQSPSNPLARQLGSIGSISDSQFSELIDNYFEEERVKPIHQNKDVGLRTNGKQILSGYSTINHRKEIKLLILKGSITEAISKIGEYFPSILDSNNLLYFKLLRLNLIEMIRNHKLDQDISNEKEKQFLNDILTFVRENLVNKVIHSSKLLKELEITMSLLCFNFDPKIKNIEDQKDLPEELRHLFNLSLRNKCYGLVNKAILNLNREENFRDRKYTSGVQFDINSIQCHKEGKSQSPSGNQNSLNDIYITNEYDILTGDEDSSNYSNTNEDQLTKLQDLTLESKLEKIIKLWTITEQRLVDLNIIKGKRYLLNDD